MTFGQAIGLIAFALLLSAGQILFKLAAVSAPKLDRAESVVALLQLPTLWAACLLYGAATILWVYLLQSTPLNRAYPFAALGFVVVPAAGVLIFGERVSATYLAGTALIIVGLALIAQDQPAA